MGILATMTSGEATVRERLREDERVEGMANGVPAAPAARSSGGIECEISADPLPREVDRYRLAKPLFALEELVQPET